MTFYSLALKLDSRGLQCSDLKELDEFQEYDQRVE